jgi:hypothetical protein
MRLSAAELSALLEECRRVDQAREMVVPIASRIIAGRAASVEACERSKLY